MKRNNVLSNISCVLVAAILAIFAVLSPLSAEGPSSQEREEARALLKQARKHETDSGQLSAGRLYRRAYQVDPTLLEAFEGWMLSMGRGGFPQKRLSGC